MLLNHLRLWTVKEYYQMVETGLLHPEEQVELLEGQIINMTPQGPFHAATTDYTTEHLRHALAGKALLRSEKPIILNQYSEPEPDIAVVHLHPYRYADRHPQVSQVYLLVEVADTTLDYDCNTKAKIYAGAGIEDYWVLNIKKRQLHTFREPMVDSYGKKEVWAETTSLSPLAFPEITIEISRLLPPKLSRKSI
ncbi:MAG: Uma2 family endonuclease [Spirulinaceae cyanobacterium]